MFDLSFTYQQKPCHVYTLYMKLKTTINYTAKYKLFFKNKKLLIKKDKKLYLIVSERNYSVIIKFIYIRNNSVIIRIDVFAA